MDRKSSEPQRFLPLTPLRSHVSHTPAQTDPHSSRAGWRNPNVLISGDKQRQGRHWAAPTHTDVSYQRPDKGTTQAPLSSPVPSTPRQKRTLIVFVWNEKNSRFLRVLQRGQVSAFVPTLNHCRIFHLTHTNKDSAKDIFWLVLPVNLWQIKSN